MSKSIAAMVMSIGVIGLACWTIARLRQSPASEAEQLLAMVDHSNLTDRAREEMRALIAAGRLRPSQFLSGIA